MSVLSKKKEMYFSPKEYWTYPPFEACISDDDFIFARGIQDMKSLGMIYLETVRRLKEAGIRLKRTVHISFVPGKTYFYYLGYFKIRVYDT